MNEENYIIFDPIGSIALFYGHEISYLCGEDRHKLIKLNASSNIFSPGNIIQIYNDYTAR